MFKMIGNLFSVTSKAIGTTVDVTNSALNEVNKGLDSFNSNLRKHTEKMELLRDLSKKVYENKIPQRLAKLSKSLFHYVNRTFVQAARS